MKTKESRAGIYKPGMTDDGSAVARCLTAGNTRRFCTSIRRTSRGRAFPLSGSPWHSNGRSPPHWLLGLQQTSQVQWRVVDLADIGARASMAIAGAGAGFAAQEVGADLAGAGAGANLTCSRSRS